MKQNLQEVKKKKARNGMAFYSFLVGIHSLIFFDIFQIIEYLFFYDFDVGTLVLLPSGIVTIFTALPTLIIALASIKRTSEKRYKLYAIFGIVFSIMLIISAVIFFVAMLS